jgi:hypothetical protein
VHTYAMTRMKRWWLSMLRGPRLRFWCLVGTVLVFVVCGALLGLAYGGVTLGLGTHDKSLLVTAAAALGALLFAAVAAALAMAAYWAASERPDLELQAVVNGSEPNPSEIVLTLGNAVPGKPARWVPAALRLGLELRNQARYSARNPAVRVLLYGFAVAELMSTSRWTQAATPRDGASREFLWGVGLDLAIHGSWSQQLDPISFLRLQLDMAAPRHEIVIEYVAEGMDRKSWSVPVRGVLPVGD